MNKYFLMIACLQLIRTITPVSPATTLGPLAIIFAISALKEAIDDRARWRQDRIANALPFHCVLRKDDLRMAESTPPEPRSNYTPTESDAAALRQIASSKLQVGDIVMIREDELIPADMVLLKSSEESGHCFIQTTNLDGETNLKGRKLARMRMHIACAHTNTHARARAFFFHVRICIHTRASNALF